MIYLAFTTDMLKYLHLMSCDLLAARRVHSCYNYSFIKANSGGTAFRVSCGKNEIVEATPTFTPQRTWIWMEGDEKNMIQSLNFNTNVTRMAEMREFDKNTRGEILGEEIGRWSVVID